jgi:hypothetical protein
MRLKFGVENWEHTDHIHAEELVSRLVSRFPRMVIDRDEGNAHVQRKLDDLIAMGTPNVILTSHRGYFGNVIYVSIAEESWHGAVAISYLHSMYPQLGDTVFFDVTAAPNKIATNVIAKELADALQMLLVQDEMTSLTNG